MHKLAAPGIFFVWQELRLAEGMMKLTAPHDTVGAYPSGYGIQTRGESRRNSYALAFFGNRSAATRPGASRGRHNHRSDAALL